MEGLTRFAAPHRFATVGTLQPDAWERILEAVDKPELWPGAVDDAVGQLPAWSLARFHNDVLPADADPVVLSVSGLAVEYMDDARVDADWLRERWGHLRFAAHTTAFHQRRLAEREPGPRWRLLLPFAAPVSLDVAVELARWVRHPAQARGEMSPVTERPDRLLPLPAMAPGGYASCVSEGEALDVELALRELKGWQDQDRVRRARAVLAGSGLDDALASVEAIAASHERFRFPAGWPGVGDSWPGRVLRLQARPEVRLGLGAALARLNAADGHPVLLCSTEFGVEDYVASMLGEPERILLGEVDGPTLEERIARLREDCPALHLWSPPNGNALAEELADRARASWEAANLRPPLIIVDERVPCAAVESAVHAVAHPHSLVDSWPGAAVVLFGGQLMEPDRVLDEKTPRLHLMSG